MVCGVMQFSSGFSRYRGPRDKKTVQLPLVTIFFMIYFYRVKSMVKVSKNLIEKAVLKDLPRNHLLLDYRCTPISSEIPSPAEILFGRKL